MCGGYGLRRYISISCCEETLAILHYHRDYTVGIRALIRVDCLKGLTGVSQQKGQVLFVSKKID